MTATSLSEWTKVLFPVAESVSFSPNRETLTRSATQTTRPAFLQRLIFFILSAACSAASASTTWPSPATGTPIPLEILEPTAPTGSSASPSASAPAPLPVVFYLLHLPAPRVGTDSDAAILADLRATGHLVVTLDYAHDTHARWPQLNRDLAALREQLQKKTFTALAGRALDPAHIFIVPAGHRLKRDVVFYSDSKRTLAIDLIYPSRPAKPVGTVLEFSCDNQDRFGNFSLNFCSDTILEAAATEGFAVAMADHPVAAPYAGFDAMPDSAWKIKAAVRTIRALAPELSLNHRIAPVGFSRGSGMALMLVTTAGHA
jgi:hypothetical protein